MPLGRMGLEQVMDEGDSLGYALTYANGAELAVVFMCIAERRWFWERKVLLVSLIGMDPGTKVVNVYSRNTLQPPRGASDIGFAIRVSKLVRVMAWVHAETGGMGECVDLPRPRHSSS
jgi:hypothetical protein